MRLLYLPPGAKEFDSVELDGGMMGGPGFVGQVAMNGALFNEAEGSALWDAVSGTEPSFKHCKEKVTGCMCVPVKTVDEKVVGVIVTLNGEGKGGFTAAHARNVSSLASKVVPLVTRFGSDVAFNALDAGDPGDAGLRSMLGNFGRGDKRDVKQVMKKRVKQLINVRRMSAMGIGEVVEAAQEDEAPPSEEAVEVLEQMSEWGPAVLHLETEKMGMMAETMVKDLGLDTEFEIPNGNFAKFATSVLSTYNDNPYHNQWHGFVVFQSCYWAIKECKIVGDCTNHLEQLSLLVAAMGHDAKHDGVNNAFHVQSVSDLTMMYNDQSPLENLHSRTTFECLKQPGCNVFEKLDTEQWHQARGVVCQTILHTDMGKHPDTVTMLKSKKGFSPNEDADRADMCNAVLHAMDLANVAYPWPECVKWARRVGTEFAEQVGKEKDAKIPVSVFMDVHGDLQLAKLQVGFVNYVIMPFFEIGEYPFSPPLSSVLFGRMRGRVRLACCCLPAQLTPARGCCVCSDTPHRRVQGGVQTVPRECSDLGQDCKRRGQTGRGRHCDRGGEASGGRRDIENGWHRGARRSAAVGARASSAPGCCCACGAATGDIGGQDRTVGDGMHHRYQSIGYWTCIFGDGHKTAWVHSSWCMLANSTAESCPSLSTSWVSITRWGLPN
jgi:hypothetical protein